MLSYGQGSSEHRCLKSNPLSLRHIASLSCASICKENKEDKKELEHFNLTSLFCFSYHCDRDALIMMVFW